MIQWKKKEKEFITFRCNFKPGGKYNEVTLSEKMMVDPSVLDDIPDWKPEAFKYYFCPHCLRRHYRGRIFEKHKKHLEKQEEKFDHIPTNHILWYNPKELRDVAYDQLIILKRKLKKADKPEWVKIYVKEINKLILHEREK